MISHQNASGHCTVDPRLSQLQSEYARRAMEDFQRINSGSNAVHAVQGSPQSSVVGALSPASSSVLGPSVSQAQQQVGGISIKRLFALSSRHAKRARGSGAGSGGDGQGTEQSIDLTLASKTYAVLSNVDSGAAMSVCPPGTFPDYPALARDDEEEIVLVAANEETVEHYGEVRPIVMTSEGHLREMVFQVAAVGKVLTSAAQICNRGHRIVLESEGERSYIEDKETGDTFNFVSGGCSFQFVSSCDPVCRDHGFLRAADGEQCPGRSAGVRPRYELHALDEEPQELRDSGSHPEFDDGVNDRSDLYQGHTRVPELPLPDDYEQYEPSEGDLDVVASNARELEDEVQEAPSGRNLHSVFLLDLQRRRNVNI